MSVWSFASSVDGRFSTHRYGGPRKYLELNTPAGFIAVEGAFDHKTQRLDLQTLEVIGYERPAEEVAAELNSRNEEESRRVILELEARQQRAVREALLVLLPAGAEKERLKAIDDEIAKKRGALSDTRRESSEQSRDQGMS